MRAITRLSLLLALAVGGPALAQQGLNLQLTPEATAEAERVLAIPAADPSGRMNQILAARDLSDAGLFALASRVPGIVEQIKTKPYTLVLDYLSAIPSPELYRVRRGETVIRTKDDIKKGSTEAKNLAILAEALKLPAKKVQSVRIGPLESRIIRVEVNTASDKGVVEMAWPSTPERDEKSRDALARVFGARPSSRAVGVGAPLPLGDGSFEHAESLGTTWEVRNGPDLGGGTPVAEVSIDDQSAIDGLSSLRFYATQRTRQFLVVSQQVTVAPTTSLVARAMLRTENVRKEFLQKDTDLYLEMSFEDITGAPVGTPIRDQGAAETHTWQALEVKGLVPDGAAYVRVSVLCGLSGTAWFDGVTLQIGE